MNYVCKWEIDIEASTPLEAAIAAREAQLRVGSMANVFDVTDEDGNTTRVDLEAEGREPDNHAVAALSQIANDERACNCVSEHSWHGDGHASQCPINIAQEALK